MPIYAHFSVLYPVFFRPSITISPHFSLCKKVSYNTFSLPSWYYFSKTPLYISIIQIFTFNNFVRWYKITNFALVRRNYVHTGGQDILKGVYYAWFWRLEILRNFKSQVKNKAAVNAPWLYRMYSLHCVTAIGVPVRQWKLWAQQGC